MIEKEENFWHFALLPWSRYSEFKGRSRRKEYWSFQLLNVLILMALVAGLFLLEEFRAIESIFNLITGVLLVYVFILVIPSLALTVRRLHDINMSGWWILIYLLPYLGSLILLIFCCMDSHSEVNKWGENPKAKQSMAISDHLIAE